MNWTEDSVGAEQRAVSSLTAPSLLLAALSFAGALATLEWLPLVVLRLAGGVLFFFGAALPLLARYVPAKPSLLKLGVISALLSPVLTTVLYLALHLGLGAQEAMIATFAILGFAQCLGIKREVHRDRLGGTAWAMIALSALAGVGVYLLLFRGSAPRASYHGLLHSALLLAVDRTVPPGNPWMAGQELGYYWFWHGMGALFSRGLAVAPTIGLALTNLWAATLLPVVLYLTAAQCWRDSKREWFGVVLALFGLSALGGWVWASRGFSWHAPENTLDLLEVLQAGVGSWDPRLAFGFSKFGNLSSYPSALVLLSGGMMCAAHALRGGVRPWVGSCAVLHGAALAVNPIVGGMGIASTGLAMLLLAPGMRIRLLLPLVAWSLPGALLVLRAGQHYAGESLGFELREGALWKTVAPVLLLLIPVVFLTRARDRGGVASENQRARVLWLLLTAALVPLVLHLVLVLPYENQYKLIRLSALPLGLLASGGLFRMLESGGPMRAAGRLLGLFMIIGLLLGNGLGFASYGSFSNRNLPLVEEPLALFPEVRSDATGEAADLEHCYRWLASHVRFQHPNTILVVNCISNTAPVYGIGEPHAFTDPRANLQGHEAAPFTGLELWCDRPSQVLDRRTPGWERRMALLLRLYRGDGGLEVADREQLTAAGRPVLILVTGSDLALKPTLGSVAQRAGWSEVMRSDRASIYAWPQSFARALAEPSR